MDTPHAETLPQAAAAPMASTSASPSAAASEAPPSPVAPPPATASTATLADGSLRMLDPAWPKVDAFSWWVTAGIAFIVAAVGLLITWLTDEVAAWVMALLVAQCAIVVLLLVLGALRWPGLAYRRTRYIVSPLGIEIRRGVIWRSVTNVPRSRIQHTDVTQGPIMRRHNLATLVMYTAGTQHAMVALPGLSHEIALQLRDFLIRGGAPQTPHAAHAPLSLPRADSDAV